ncbi:hypothetical protein B7463_g6615, partial [Scytalidium lignicola]
MTERLLSITTQIATPIQTSFPSATPLSATNDAHTVVESVDEEPYTIKCICDFSDDDGNTIYCETCDTWQHIECFYPGRVDDASRAEFDHSCADCKPRPLDRKHATERQRHQRENKILHDSSSEKKTKRPPSKSHKKKSKPSDLQVNGYHYDADAHRNGSPQDHPFQSQSQSQSQAHSHSKKTKGHRSSQSISSQAKRSPPLPPSHSRSNTVVHPPSPAHTPQELPYGLPLSSYSDTFLHLYKDDPGAQAVPTNSFANLNVPNAMSLWLKEPEKLQQDAGVKAREDVFQNLTVPVDKLKWRELRVERKEATWNGMLYQWRYLTTPTQLSKSGLRIGELNGLVGFQKDYCSDKENRWTESIHPRPFIFFHPHLPLFIDTRKEGSICRYVRRSCRANATLETYIAGETEYHFWLVSERPLAANEQITLSWDFRFPSQVQSRFMHVLDLGDDDGSHYEGPDLSDEEYEQLSNVISGVLADYGGCACDLGNDCAFVRFLNRNLHGRSSSQEHASANANANANGTKPKKSRRPKLHVSPTSTGHATNSRAASEGQQESYDAEDDSHSVSGSSRSKPQSRDLTPLHTVAEPNGILTEPSDREKRKLAMLEDTFKKMEQAQQPPRKKKRASDGPNSVASATGQQQQQQQQQHSAKAKPKSAGPRGSISHPSAAAAAAKNGVNGNKGKQYVDAATSQRQSGSPFSGISPTAVAPSPRNPPSRPASIRSGSRQPSLGPKSSYVDAGTQTDGIDNDWYCPEKMPLRKRSIVSLSKRLLKNRHKIRRSLEMQQADPPQIGYVNGTDAQMSNAPPLPLPPPPQPASAPIPEPVPLTMELDTPQVMDHGSVHSPVDVKESIVAIVPPASPSEKTQISSADVDMPDAPAVVDIPLKPSAPLPEPKAENGTSDNSSPPAVDGPKHPEPRIQLPTSPIVPAANIILGTPTVATPSSTTASSLLSPFPTLLPQTPSASVGVNGVSQPSPIKTTKKLSLSDYKARLKRTDSATNNKPAPESYPTTVKPSLGPIEEVKANGIIEEPAVVDSPVAEKTTDPLAVIATPAAESTPNLASEPNGDIDQTTPTRGSARSEEVEELRDEKEEEGLGEVALDSYDGEDHAGEVAVGVADEDARGVPVVHEQGEGDADEGDEHVEGEEVGVGRWVGVRDEEVETVVEDEEEGDDEGLGDFDAVYPGEDVDAVGAEDGDAGHDWDAGYAGDEEFVAPADIEEVVAQAEDHDGLEGEDAG